MSGRPRRADPGGCAAVTASGRPSNAHSGGVPVVESRGQASTRTPGSDDYASPAPGAASPDGSPENPLARGGYMDSGIGAGRVVPRADVLEHRASTSPAAQAGAGSFQGSIPQYQRNGSGLFDNHPQRSHPRHVEHRAAGGTVRGVASPTVAFRTSRSDSTPGDWDGNLRFLRSVAITWIVGLVVYTVLVAGGAMLALSAPYSLVLGTLLFLEVSVMLLLYTTMFVRLIKAAKLRLMRLLVSAIVIVFLLLSIAIMIVGAVMESAQIFKIGVASICGSLLVCVAHSTYLFRPAHLQILEMVRTRTLQMEPYSAPARALNSAAVDITCCRWLGVGIPSAWSEATARVDEDQYLLPGYLQRPLPNQVPTSLTWRLYISMLMRYVCCDAIEAQPFRSPDAGSLAHQFPASGNHRDHHPVSSGFPAHGSQPMPSSPPPVIFPTHSVRQQPVMQFAGLSSLDNDPKEDADSQHQYFCPICMLYYGQVFKTSCCSNYICQECSVVYVTGKRKKAEEAMLASLSLDADHRLPIMSSSIVECPYCQGTSMLLRRVHPWEHVKSYEDEERFDDISVDGSEKDRSTCDKSMDKRPSSNGKAKVKRKGKGKVDAKFQIAIGDDFAALHKKIDYTGFTSLDNQASSPGRPDMDFEANSGNGNFPQLPELPPVGEESGHFEDGNGGDVLLPNETDFLPKGLCSSPGSGNTTWRTDSLTFPNVDAEAILRCQQETQEAHARNRNMPDYGRENSHLGRNGNRR